MLTPTGFPWTFEVKLMTKFFLRLKKILTRKHGPSDEKTGEPKNGAKILTKRTPILLPRKYPFMCLSFIDNHGGGVF